MLAWIKANPGRAVVGAVAVLGIVLGAFFAYRASTGRNTLRDSSNRRTMIDSVTGEVYEEYPLPTGATFPYINPKTKDRTLYPAEACYWNKDGTAKLEPTWVLLNTYAGKPGPTVCPDCGRVVVGHNPTPPDELMIEAAKRAQGG